jgi:putative hydrolase of the HAD superfamily
MALFPGAVAALEQLRQQGTRLALVTNGDRRHQRRKIDDNGIARFFEVVVIEGEFGVGKPDSAVYRQALRALGAAPTEAWMVGDHLVFDVDAPQQLGLRGVWMDRGGRGLPADSAVRPHRIIRSLDELIARGG